jgi:hypothetical protein
MLKPAEPAEDDVASGLVIVRSYLDQLVRNSGLAAERTAAISLVAGRTR